LTPAAGWIHAPGVFISLVTGPHSGAQPGLFEIVYAGDVLGFGFASGQRRQNHASEDGNDGDDDQQFDEGEGGSSLITFHKTCHARRQQLALLLLQATYNFPRNTELRQADN
jgi:hypothetical protein